MIGVMLQLGGLWCKFVPLIFTFLVLWHFWLIQTFIKPRSFFSWFTFIKHGTFKYVSRVGLRNLKILINCFELVLGFSVNWEKSCFMGLGCTQSEFFWHGYNAGLQSYRFSSQYLGFPLGGIRDWNRDWNFLGSSYNECLKIRGYGKLIICHLEED